MYIIKIKLFTEMTLGNHLFSEFQGIYEESGEQQNISHSARILSKRNIRMGP